MSYPRMDVRREMSVDRFNSLPLYLKMRQHSHTCFVDLFMYLCNANRHRVFVSLLLDSSSSVAILTCVACARSFSTCTMQPPLINRRSAWVVSLGGIRCARRGVQRDNRRRWQAVQRYRNSLGPGVTAAPPFAREENADKEQNFLL